MHVRLVQISGSINIMTYNHTGTPLISVIMPVYNGEQYLEEAIDSILIQTWKNLELWVCDDCSTDATSKILEQYAKKDNRVKTLRNPKNRGTAKTINKLLDSANSDIIVRMDADDIALPYRIERQYHYMQQHELDVCGSWIKYKGGYPGKVRYPTSNEAVRLHMMFRPPFAQPAVMHRLSAFEGLRHKQDALLPEDYDLWTRLPVNLKFGNIPEVLLLYRRHKGQSSGRKSKIKKERARPIKEYYLRRTIPDITEHQLETHLKLRGASELDEAGLLETREWLTSLAERYTGNACLQTLRNEWFFAISNSSLKGFPMWKLYNNSGDLKYQRQAKLKVMLLWLSCLLHIPYSRLTGLPG